MQFVLVGPHQGKTISLAGFRFKDGVTEVDSEAKDAHNLLRQFYSAHPAHLIEKDAKGVLSVRDESDPNAKIEFTPKPLPKSEIPVDLLKKDELILKATELGLDSTGNKDELIARIKEALA